MNTYEWILIINSIFLLTAFFKIKDIRETIEKTAYKLNELEKNMDRLRDKANELNKPRHWRD